MISEAFCLDTSSGFQTNNIPNNIHFRLPDPKDSEQSLNFCISSWSAERQLHEPSPVLWKKPTVQTWNYSITGISHAVLLNLEQLRSFPGMSCSKFYINFDLNLSQPQVESVEFLAMATSSLWSILCHCCSSSNCWHLSVGTLFLLLRLHFFG